MSKYVTEDLKDAMGYIIAVNAALLERIRRHEPELNMSDLPIDYAKVQRTTDEIFRVAKLLLIERRRHKYRCQHRLEKFVAARGSGPFTRKEYGDYHTLLSDHLASDMADLAKHGNIRAIRTRRVQGAADEYEIISI
jgi:hypothetical protein